MAKNSVSINLLKTPRNETIGQIINWALTIGRTLVITVELVALCAFIYRFSLDSQLQDLRTKIKDEQTIVGFLKQNENTFRNFQDTLSIASSASKTGKQNATIYKDILNFAPAEMTFKSVTFSTNKVNIQADVTSINALSEFINSLKAYPDTDSIALDKIENKTSSALISVSVTVNLKQTKGGINAISKN